MSIIRRRWFITTSLVGSLLVCSLWMTGLSAATEMNPEKVLTLNVAKQGITRISVEGDKIVDTYVDPQEAASSIKNNRGHLYLSGQSSIPTLFVSLITKIGSAQDLKLVFKEVPAKPIVLKSPSQVTEDLEPEMTASAMTVRWLQAFLKGHVPEGFTVTPLESTPPEGIPSRTHGPITATPISVWKRPEGYVVMAFRLSTQESVSLKPEAFQQPGDTALVCSTKSLAPDQEATLYVLSRNVISQTTPSFSKDTTLNSQQPKKETSHD